MLALDVRTWCVSLAAFVLPLGLLFWRARHGSLKSHKRLESRIVMRVADPDPLHNFDLDNARIRDHIYANKPLRYPYFQTMAHQRMHINDWIEIDKEFRWYLDEKARVMKEQGKNVLDSLPENDEACTELLQVLADWLPKRYPTLFEELGSSGEGIWNKVTDERYVNLKNKRGVDALRVVSRLVPDDFLMAREREDGHVYCVGGLVAFPGSYLLSEKMDQCMRKVHESAPYFNEKLLVSVERMLKRFQPHEPFERTSWMIVDDRKLFWHGIASLAPGETVAEDLHPKDLYLRLDHQTFRKLPRTRAIVFGVRPVLRRLEDLADSPLAVSLLAKIHEGSDRKLLEYKHSSAYHSKIAPYLDELRGRQIDKGRVK